MFKMQVNLNEFSGALAANIKAFLVVDLIVALLTIVGNSIFIVTLVKMRRLHTPSNVLLGALSISDSIVGMAVQPLWIAESSNLLGKEQNPKLRSIKILLTVVCSGLSFQFLAVVSMDRYVAICHPFLYFAKATCRTHVCVSIILVLINAAFYGLLAFLPTDKGMQASFFITCGISVLILSSNVMIFKTLLKKRTEIVTVGDLAGVQSAEATTVSSKPRSKQISRQKRERNKAHVILIIMLLFFICYTPWMTQNALSLWNMGVFKSSAGYALSELWTDFFVLVNSCVNPLVYYSRVKEIRSAAKEIFCCK